MPTPGTFLTDLTAGLAADLAAASLGLVSAVTGTVPGGGDPIFDTIVPPKPGRIVTLTCYGLGDDPTLNQSAVGLQVRTRGATQDPAEPRNLSDAIGDRLLGRYPLTLTNAIRVTTIVRQSAVSLGQEDGGDRRWSYVSNYRLNAYNPTTHRL